MESTEKIKNKKSKTVKVLLIIVLILALIVAALYFIMHNYLDKINRVDPSVAEDIIPPEEEDFEVDSTEKTTDNEGNAIPEVEASSIEWADIEAIADDDLINILLVGQDTRVAGKRSRSDSMILCSINPSTGKVSLISFLRDLYVELPGNYSDNRLNTAYKFGGFKLLNETLAQNFGVSIDGNIEVDFDRFILTIDTIGGVEIELSKAEAERIGDGVIAGKNLLTGEQALEYARIRKIDNDFHRTERQRNVIMAVFNKVKALNISEMYMLINELLPCFVTDMSNDEMLSIAANLIPMMSSLEISTYHIPGDGTYKSARINGMAVLVPNKALIREKLTEEYLPLN